MNIDELFSFLKKKGFRDTFYVLSKFKNHKTDKHTFYNELNKFSYYNSFFRIKDELIKKGLIEITDVDSAKNSKKKNKSRKNNAVIQLTKKGKDVYDKLIEINQLIHSE
ncbi:MAG: hypothetical protein ACTSWE_02675 [Promethearchaeota archaeon]